MLSQRVRAARISPRTFDDRYICSFCRHAQKRARHHTTSAGRTTVPRCDGSTQQRVDDTKSIHKRSTNRPFSRAFLPWNYTHGVTSIRRHHSTRSAGQELASVLSNPPPDIFEASDPTSSETPPSPSASHPPYSGIRAKLAKWQELRGEEPDDFVVMADDIPKPGEPVNSYTRLQSEASRNEKHEQDDNKDVGEDLHNPLDEPAEADVLLHSLSPGDLVECTMAGGSGKLAIYIRGDGMTNQLFSPEGRWMIAANKQLVYHVPNFVDPKLIEPIIQYLPDLAIGHEEYKALLDKVVNEDINAPRSVSAPLFKVLTAFADRVREVYRNHAARLDDAHRRLANSSDLKHMDLSAAASELLQKPVDSLTVHELYATHKALSHDRFAFGIDERSHRQTGQVEIRAKDKVMTVARVVNMIHAWQEDQARETMSVRSGGKRHAEESSGSKIIKGFLEKARSLILDSRTDREPTPMGIGPSKHKYAISPRQPSVMVRTLADFTKQEREIVDFLRSWCLERTFAKNTHLSALAPLIMQGTGLYKEVGLGVFEGQVFLQELGVIPPFEGAYKHDQYLHLVDFSSHSQQNNTSRIDPDTGRDLRDTFVDQMADLRRDWGDLPVYCIDDAGAFEIDDGISVAPGQPTADGKPTHWTHVHVANPTAFFGPEHVLAKYAERMGESIYTPERAFMMMPPWTARNHFSLGENRPCMTFSARMDMKGNILERDISVGTLKKVFSITPQELTEVLGSPSTRKAQTYTLTVGGMPPPGKSRKSTVPNLTKKNLTDLCLLQKLSDALQRRRREAGGIFFEVHRPEAKIWWTWHESERSSSAFEADSKRPRQFDGDPVIQTSLRQITNWFDPLEESAKALVREMMLLACETAAVWCADRKIPGIFRGTLASTNADRTPAQFYQEVLAPQAKDTGGKFPLEMGFEYLKTFGKSGLSTKPFKHQIIGLDNYGKVTSPLRRYGDMVVHWQIEAALREEARLGKSLITHDPNVSRDFLPFSRDRLQRLMTVLQPRERLITRVKQTSIAYWVTQLLFRAFHFEERMDAHLTAGTTSRDSDALSLATLPTKLHVLITHPPTPQAAAQGRIIEFGLHVFGLGFDMETVKIPDARVGDVWESAIVTVQPVSPNINMRLSKLLYRVGEDGYKGWFGQGPRLDLFGQEQSKAASWGQTPLAAKYG